MPDFGKFLTGTVMFQNKADSVVVTIADVRVISQYDREVIDFEETLYGEYSSLPLNAVNTTRLRKLFGRDRDAWVGQVIELTWYHAPNPKNNNELTHAIYVDDGTGPPDLSNIGSRGQQQPAKAPAKQPAKAPAKQPAKAPAKQKT